VPAVGGTAREVSGVCETRLVGPSGAVARPERWLRPLSRNLVRGLNHVPKFRASSRFRENSRTWFKERTRFGPICWPTRSGCTRHRWRTPLSRNLVRGVNQVPEFRPSARLRENSDRFVGPLAQGARANTRPRKSGLLRERAVAGCPIPRSPGIAAAANRVWLVQPGGLDPRSPELEP
jgi:hypothetical protein